MKLLLVLLLISTPAFAWSDGDTKREAAYIVLHTMDWAQTRQIAKCQNAWHEQNGILGDCPSISDVNRYFAITGIAHYLIAKTLPEKYRAPFQYLTIGVEAGAVAHNYSIGIKVGF